ncbi:putative monovalent cation/H+ antiporter subunit A [Aggregatilinea lenta]|uniref:putative monovalent cation/H+ antiporter subunit A n=1 Tax=Aggregatilinea lenta TaxID=913108 RepID=UPI000E5B35D2|nr:putative monovalent cation/H+ antiporter subunit A [Aggregatilinea lenta]
MSLAVISGFAAAPAVPLLYRLAREKTGWIVALLPLSLFVYFASLLGRIVDGQIVTAAVEWVPSLDVNLTFRTDGLSLVFALIITGIGTLVFLYGGAYLHGHAFTGRFYTAITLFMASMLGVVMADNIILLFVFWELTSFTSYVLIGFYNEREAARDAARQALIVTSAGGLFMLAGLILLSLSAGTWEISEIVARGAAIQADDRYVAALILILLGAFTKSAQFPFHFWLPGAMEAPAPVSAYLHSATMVNAGIYLMARLHPALGGTDEWHVLVTAAGAATMLLGGYLAWQKTDLKQILAYSTVSALGIMTFLLGLGTEETLTAAMLFLLVHALYKGALFMVAGSVDHATGTREIGELGGLRRAMPMTALAAALAALSMAGLPPLLGFVAKELIYEGTLHLHDTSAWIALITLLAVLGNLFNVTAAGLAAIRPFWGKVKSPHTPHDVSATMWAAPLILGGLSLALGVALTAYEPVLERMVEAVHGEPVHLHLALWHGWTTMLALSGVTFAGGLALYLAAPRLSRPAVSLGRALDPVAPSRLYADLIHGTVDAATAGSRIILTAYLRQYIRVIMITLVAALGYVFATRIEFDNLLHSSGVRVYEVVIAGVIIAAALTVTQLNKRLSAAAALGVVGYGVTLIYILYGAPDLAMTQFAIETLTVILFVVVIYRLPKLKQLSSTTARRMDAVLAVVVGVTMTLLTLVVTSVPMRSQLSPFFAEMSYIAAHGHNVVNVILVDFRGFDTMGEITVLSVAAIGVFALLRLNLDKPKPGEQRAPERREPEERGR